MTSFSSKLIGYCSCACSNFWDVRVNTVSIESTTMPQSKNRKKRIAEQRRNILKARRRLEREQEKNVETSNSELSEQNRNPEGENVCCTKADEITDIEQQYEEDHGEAVNGKNFWSGFSSISNLYSWCQCSLTQGVESAKDTLFPSRVLRRELEVAQKKMVELENELQRVKKAKRRRSKSFYNENLEDAVPSLPPPPPPPPPPPVLPPPPPPSLVSLPRRTSPRKKIKVAKNQPVITLDDLKSIKLKRAGDRSMKQKRRSTESCHVEWRQLRSSYREGLNRQSINVEPSELQQRRYSLRKLNIEKSPGGTPMFPSRDYTGTGDGLAPLMTRALKRKFETAYPISPEKDVPPVDKGVSPSVLSSSEHPLAPPNTAETSVIHNSLSSISLFEVRDV